MATPNRSTQINKLHKVLKKHYKAVPPPGDLGVLELLLFACCLENASYEAAQRAFAALQSEFFDWNEVRVSGIRELAEAMDVLPDPTTAGTRVKRSLQGIFEASYKYDLEGLKKLKLGQASEMLQKFGGVPPFVIAYVTQVALGGHAIPLDRGALDALEVLGIITPAEREAGTVAGLERTIAKSKGLEFASLLHQLAVDFAANPYSPTLHKLLLEIAPEIKPNLPKKGVRPAPADRPPPARERKDTKSAADKPATPASAPRTAESKKKPAAATKKAVDKPAEKEKTADKPPPAGKKSASRPTPKAAAKPAPRSASASATKVTKRKPR